MYTKSAIIAGLASIASAAPIITIPISFSTLTGATCPKASQLDNPQFFVVDPVLAGEASYAQTPSSYTRQFVSLKASNVAPGYMQYQNIDVYNPATCAAICDSLTGCESFNIYFERAPFVDPSPDCPNPASNYNVLGVKNVKCAFYSSILTNATAVNNGQFRQSFQVAITGSNGYVKKSIFQPGPGFQPAPGYGNDGHVPSDMAINAPLDCNGNNTFAGQEWWSDGQFSVSRCAQSCSRHNDWVKAQGGSRCNTFSTFLQTQGNNVQQMCTFYTQTWDPSYAVNGGNNDGSLVVSTSYMFSVNNATAPSCPVAKSTSNVVVV